MLKPCPCGKPWPDQDLYDPAMLAYVHTQVETLGEFVRTTILARPCPRTFLVSRYCIAFHGITAQQLLSGKSGFDEVDGR